MKIRLITRSFAYIAEPRRNSVWNEYADALMATARDYRAVAVWSSSADPEAYLRNQLIECYASWAAYWAIRRGEVDLEEIDEAAVKRAVQDFVERWGIPLRATKAAHELDIISWRVLVHLRRFAEQPEEDDGPDEEPFSPEAARATAASIASREKWLRLYEEYEKHLEREAIEPGRTAPSSAEELWEWYVQLRDELMLQIRRLTDSDELREIRRVSGLLPPTLQDELEEEVGVDLWRILPVW